MRLLLIRHGETDWNATLRYQGQGGVPLNAQGRAQARRVGERLARYGAAALYTSDIGRASETAAIVGELTGLVPASMPDLREIDVGQWEGLTPEELYRRFPDHMREYERDPARTVRLGGESYAQLQVRAMRALHTIHAAHPGDQTVLAVSHGGTIRALLCHVIGLDLIHFGRLWLDNGSLTELRHGSNGWRLLRLNDAAHMEGMDFAKGE
ncbi:MAG TPA: histidine phosphatase family protein [Roseiflexaceae bacterium]|nr:histidine phosphatase family protein [Roseiflexaceae bacterium]